MHKYEKIELTNMCMIYDNNGNVVVQEKLNKNWGGITFPGGHIEILESFVDSIIREVKEETNLDVEIDANKRYTMEYVTDKGTLKQVVLFIAKCTGGEIKAQECEVNDIKHPKICGIKWWEVSKNKRYVVLLFKTNEYSGTLQSSDEGKVFWAKLDELKSMKLAESFDKMLKVFTDDDVQEHIQLKNHGEWIDILK